MTSTRTRILSAFVIAIGLAAPTLALGCQTREQDPKGFDPDRLAKVQAALDQAVADGKVAGASALILRDDQRVALMLAGDADREAGRPMAEDTIVRIASMSKPITSVAAMILVDEGKLQLDDPVSKFIPEFADLKVLPLDRTEGEPKPVEAAMTVHHLLTHTSGLSYRFSGGPDYVTYNVSDGLVETPGTLADNMVRLAQAPLVFEPGSAWNYSLSTDVLGRVIEVASGQDFDEFLRTRVFEPLKMADTQFLVPAAKRDRLAAVYGANPDRKVSRIDSHPIQDGVLVYSSTYSTWDTGHYYSGGAGLTSTLGDYARFLRMLLNRGELDGARLLEPETVDLMTSDRLGDLPLAGFGHGERFGYGFGITSETPAPGNPFSPGTYSWGGFFATDFWVDPSKRLIVIVFTQTYPSVDSQLREDFRRLVYESLSEPKPEVREAP